MPFVFCANHVDTVASLRPHLSLSDDGGGLQRAGKSYSNTPSSPLRVRAVYQTPGKGEDP